MSTWGLASNSTQDTAGRHARREDRPERDRPRVVPQSALPDIERALALLPGVTCVMTAAFENRRAGIMVSRVMRCADEPACVCVAVPTGQRLATLIRDSRSFALCMVERSNRLLMKKFADTDDVPGDPFDMLEVRTLVTGSPVLVRASMSLDCEVMRHLDLEADHEIYVGQVLSAAIHGAPVHTAHAAGLPAQFTQSSPPAGREAGLGVKSPAAAPGQPT